MGKATVIDQFEATGEDGQVYTVLVFQSAEDVPTFDGIDVHKSPKRMMLPDGRSVTAVDRTLGIYDVVDIPKIRITGKPLSD